MSNLFCQLCFTHGCRALLLAWFVFKSAATVSEINASPLLDVLESPNAAHGYPRVDNELLAGLTCCSWSKAYHVIVDAVIVAATTIYHVYIVLRSFRSKIMLIVDPFLVFNYPDLLHQQRFYLKYVTELLLAAFFSIFGFSSRPPVLQSGSRSREILRCAYI